MKKTKFTLIAIALLLALVLGACTEAATPTPPAESGTAIESSLPSITAEGKLLPSQAAELAFAQGGVIAEVLVKPGKKVAEGVVIASLVGAESAHAELAAAQLEQINAQQAFDAMQRNALLTASQVEKAFIEAEDDYDSESGNWNLGNEDNATDLELAIDDYVNTEEDYRDARDELEDQMEQDASDAKRKDAQKDFDEQADLLAKSYKDLLKAVADNDKLLTDKETRLLGAIGTLEAAREDRARLDDNNLDAEKFASAEARLTAATALVTAAEATLKLYELSAPFGGTVLSHDLVVGETALPGAPAAYLADTSAWIVETEDLAEMDIASVALGQIAYVELDAFPGEEFSAKVTAIDPVGKEYLGDMTYKVTVTLDEADKRFKWFMTATVSIQVEE
jgi:multidrug efflux pump subunit AcrA (membrane-fusion protein)